MFRYHWLAKERSIHVIFAALVLATALVPARQHEQSSSADDKQENEQLSPDVKMYLQLFKQQRLMHREAMKSIVGLGSFEKQHQMLSIILDKLFQVMGESRVVLTSAGYIPGLEIPQNQTLRDAVSKIAENTAFFGDLVLRLPDLTHSIYDRHNEWNALLHWGIKFCNSTGLFQEDNQKLLKLMAQEVNMVQREPTYINPYTEKYVMEQRMKEQEAVPKPKKKAKKKRPRGPQMSRAEL